MPSSKELCENKKPCKFHKHTDKIVKRCALRKCKEMWKIISDPQEMKIE